MAALKMATFNLYHFAEPGIFWHERKPAATYSQTQWAEKKAWITSMVAGMDADVIGFQEVVSHEELGALMAASGLSAFLLHRPPDAR